MISPHGSKTLKTLLLEGKEKDEELKKVLREDQVPEDMIAAERDIFTAQARESGKPDTSLILSHGVAS